MAIENEKVEVGTTEKLDAELAASADEIMGGEPLVEPDPEENTDADAGKTEDASVVSEKAGEGDQTADDGTGEKNAVASEKDDTEKGGSADAKSDASDETPKPGEKPDADEYAMPDDLAPRSQERFQSLVTATKDAKAEVEKRDEVINGFRGMIEKTGLDNQELDNLFSLGTQIKNNPAEALKTLQGVIVKLSETVGVAPPGTDTLEGFDDLRDKVDAGTMSEEDASEVAGARRKQSAITLQQEHQQRSTLQTQEQQAAVDKMDADIQTGHDSVLTFLQEAEKELDFESLVPHVREAIDFASKNLDPGQWLGYIQNDYSRVKRLVASSQQRNPTPLTDDTNQGAGGKAPETLEELADAML